MDICQILRVCLLVGWTLAHAGRGTFSRNSDGKFQMMIAGGLIPDHGSYVRNLVSIRTLNFIKYHGDNHFCTGVILSSRTVLTAAHCVTDRHKAIVVPRGLLVVFGSVNRLESYGKDDTRRVDRIVVHPNYRRYVIYDVAVLRLVDRIPGNKRHVMPIVKRKKITVIPGMKCITMGWGQMYPHGPYSNEIMYLDIVVQEHDYCQNMANYDSEGNICGKPFAEGQVCPGDLGGPLICHDDLGGIIGGAQQCQGIKAIKFVNYSYVENWIDNTVLKLSSGNSICLSPLLYALHVFIFKFF